MCIGNRANTITGGSGDDILTGGKGGDFLIGGAGEDVAVLAGVRADYVFASGAGGTRVSESVADRDGSDSLSAVGRCLLYTSDAAHDLLCVAPSTRHDIRTQTTL